MKNPNKQLEIKDLLFFDDLAIYYLLQEVPLSIIAKAFTVLDPRLTTIILKLLDQKQRETLYFAISKENHNNEEESESAKKGILIIAQNLIDKGMITKEGIYFYGKKKN